MFLDQPVFVLLPVVVFYYVIPIYLGYYIGRSEKAPVNLILPMVIICLFYLVRPFEINSNTYLISVIVPALGLLFSGYLFGVFTRKVVKDSTIPYIIGVTGLPCSGKSEASRTFSKLGAKVIDVDKLGHNCLNDPDIIEIISAEFGNDIRSDDGKIDRAKLGDIVFASDDMLRKLESILHPEMIRKIDEEIKFIEPEAVLVLDAAILQHMKLDKICKRVFVTYADKALRINWAAERGWNEAELDRRDSAVKKKLLYRDITLIENNNSKELFINNIKTIWKEISNER